MRSRAWCFTYNNHRDINEPREWFNQNSFVRWIIWQFEVGEKKQTPHLQGYLCCSKKVSLKYLKKHVHPTANFKKRWGTHKQAKEYCCKKDETYRDGPWTVGEEPNQGARTDLSEIAEEIENGISLAELWRDHATTLYRYHSGILKHFNHCSRQRDWPTKCMVIWGAPGVGKSWLAKQMYPPGKKSYWCLPHSKWWTGYRGQANIVIDNYTGWFKWAYLMRLIDEYPMEVEIKGGSVPFLARNIVITTVIHPSNWYRGKDLQGDMGELFRRVSCFVRKDFESVQCIELS